MKESVSERIQWRSPLSFSVSPPRWRSSPEWVSQTRAVSPSAQEPSWTDGNNRKISCYWCQSGLHSWLVSLSDPFSHLGLRELNLELLHLLPELSDDPSVGVLIHHGVVDDSLGSVGITERGQSFFIVISCWTHCGYHGRLAVAAEIVLNTKTCQRERNLSFLSACMVQRLQQQRTLSGHISVNLK